MIQARIRLPSAPPDGVGVEHIIDLNRMDDVEVVSQRSNRVSAERASFDESPQSVRLAVGSQRHPLGGGRRRQWPAGSLPLAQNLYCADGLDRVEYTYPTGEKTWSGWHGGDPSRMTMELERLRHCLTCACVPGQRNVADVTEVRAEEPHQLGVRSVRPPDLPALTGIRFWAALWVVFFHFHQPMEAAFPGWDRLHPLTSTGGYGVDLFFILSGFVITYNYAGQFVRPTGRLWLGFLGLRLARMYPVHIVTLLVVGLIALCARVTGQTVLSTWNAPDFVRQLLLINAWRDDGYLNWNYPSWSISAEWFAYSLFPVLLLVALRARSAWLSVALAGASLGLFGLCIQTGYEWPLLRVVMEFACGMFLVRVHHAVRPHVAWDAVASVAVGAVAVIVWVAPPQAQPHMLIATFAVLVLALSRCTGFVRGALGARLAVFLGGASYSLYMTHAIVELLGTRYMPIAGTAGDSLLVRLGLAGAYAVALMTSAVAMYLWVEEPSRRALSRRVQSWQRVAGPPERARQL